MDLQSIYKKKLGSLHNYIALVIASSKQYPDLNIKILKFLVNEQKNPGVYVTVGKPCTILRRDLQNANINPELIIFIDCISHVTSLQKKRMPSCLLIENPERLSDISLAIDQAVTSIKNGDKFLYVDSLSTLLIHNRLETIEQFSFYLTSKIREWGIKGVYIMLKKDKDQELIDDLTPLCDVRIEV